VKKTVSLTLWSRVLLKKVIVTHLVKELTTIDGTKRSLPCSKQPNTGSYPELHECSAHPPTPFS
jgi:hypothetical protein